MEDKELKEIIAETIGNDEEFLNTTIYEIVKRIIDLPNETETTIAKLIDYNSQNEFVEPLLQGQIFNLVEDVCEKVNVYIELTSRDRFIGLAYYYPFKKVTRHE